MARIYTSTAAPAHIRAEVTTLVAGNLITLPTKSGNISRATDNRNPAMYIELLARNTATGEAPSMEYRNIATVRVYMKPSKTAGYKYHVNVWLTTVKHGTTKLGDITQATGSVTAYGSDGRVSATLQAFEKMGYMAESKTIIHDYEDGVVSELAAFAEVQGLNDWIITVCGN